MCRQELPDAALTYSASIIFHGTRPWADYIWSDQLTGLNMVSQLVLTGTARDLTVPPNSVWDMAQGRAGHPRSWDSDSETRQLKKCIIYPATERCACISFWGKFLNKVLKNDGSKEGQGWPQYLLLCPLVWSLWSVALMFSAVAARLQLRPNAASSLYNLSLDKVAQSERRGHFLAASLAFCALNGGFRWSKFCSWFSKGEHKCFMLDRWENLIRSDEWSHSLSLCLCFSVIKSLCACLAELTYKRMVFLQPGKENLSRIIISFHRITGSFKCFTG